MPGVRGLVLEGVACAGKSTLLRGLLAHPAFTERPGLSTLVLTEHHTLRVLEPRRASLTVADNVELLRDHVDYVARLSARLAGVPQWRDRPNPALTVIFERFHLSHVVGHQHLGWEDVAGIDGALADLGLHLCLLAVSAAELRRRLLADRGPAWGTFLADPGVRDRLREAHDVDEQIDHLLRQQDTFRIVAARSRMPVVELDTSRASPAECLAPVLELLSRR